MLASLCGLLIVVCVILLERLIANYRTVKIYERYFYTQGQEEYAHREHVSEKKTEGDTDYALPG